MENKTKKYLKYAIGEIILVVIGILIALWINNWNNQRLADNQTTNFLKNIKEDLVSDTLEFDNRIDFYKDLIDEKKKLLLLSSYEKINTDSLSVLISATYALYEINNTTFTKITNLGISKLSKNDKLSKKIYSYYTIELKTFSEFINWEKEDTGYEGRYWSNFQNEYEFNNDEFPKFQDSIINKQNLIKLITEPKGRNQILYDYYRKKRILAKYEEMKVISSELINDIQKDLNTN
ncbi:DUF6090 family protein [Polaribacter dokdonensis]|uniref:Uncharacterized protein n=1 Tax=Polaribacter dokdonensis DSW-5 TaxID=1300348 RepID=A0A0M9CHE0_9FLAO|nr:DUF6090 family protein [Polaribacter dokdonensis]KOY51995.1 hypothetical protein I602_1555 [Polaribacter dokdonensis DSW-5]SED98117.1 hypothetical protein SAMN05444353_0211 [Polaribacter dokdonensis DSW-5]